MSPTVEARLSTALAPNVPRERKTPALTITIGFYTLITI
jgi:hypothetical protein